MDPARTSVRAKLAALWAAIMFLYVYADVLSFYRPGHIDDLRDGMMGPLDVSQVTLAAASVVVILPAAMIFLSLVLPSSINRWTNITAGIAFTLVNIGNLLGETWGLFLDVWSSGDRDDGPDRPLCMEQSGRHLLAHAVWSPSRSRQVPRQRLHSTLPLPAPIPQSSLSAPACHPCRSPQHGTPQVQQSLNLLGRHIVLELQEACLALTPSKANRRAGIGDDGLKGKWFRICHVTFNVSIRMAGGQLDACLLR